MKEEYLNNEIVKSLLTAGFSEEYIEKAIASGDIRIEKSENKAAEGDHESETKQEKDIDKLEDKIEKKEEKINDDEKNTAKDKDAEGVEKSMEEVIMKSLDSVLSPRLDRLTQALESMESKLDKIGTATPSFRSEGLENMTALQKSMSLEKDDQGKFEINIINQRPIASKMIEKALENETDDSIKKSLEADALAFLTNPYTDTVGEGLARYMYNKTGVKFVK